MAVTSPTGVNGSKRINTLSPEKFMDLGTYLSVAGKPDNINMLTYIYGNEAISGIDGLLEAVGARKRAGSQDTVDWWEKQRRHFSDEPTASGATGALPANAQTPIALTFAAAHRYIAQDKVLLYTAINGSAAPISATVTDDDTNSDGLQITVAPDAPWAAALLANDIKLVMKFGNDFGQGTNQPTATIIPNVSKYSQSYFILKNVFTATGSQLTNVQWVVDPVTGDDRWVYFGDKENSLTHRDQKEMMMTVGKKITNTAVSDINGSEGLFKAINDRGIRMSGNFSAIDDFEDLALAFDGQAGAQNVSGGSERIMFLNRANSIAVSNIVATLGGAAGFANSTIGAASFGTFQNADQAVKLGFKSFYYGGYTYHLKDYKLLNDRALLGHEKAGYYKGVIFPMATYTDPKTGSQSSVLEISEKAYGDYNRGMETWTNGAANGVYNNSDGFDGLLFHKRTEAALVARGANNMAIIQG